MSGLAGMDDQAILRRVLNLLTEASVWAGKCDAALASTIRSRCGYLTNASRAIYTRPLSDEERRMIATHIKKLTRLINQAKGVSNG